MTRSSKPAAPIEPGPVDVSLAATLIGLIAFGVVMVYSASAVYASNMYGNGHHFLVRQTVFALIAFVTLAVFAHVKIDWLRKSTYPVLLLAVLLMLAVALGLGRSAGGATRWIAVGPVNVQPAELAKLAMIMWLAHSLAKKAHRVRTFSIGFLPHVIVAGLLMTVPATDPTAAKAVAIVAHLLATLPIAVLGVYSILLERLRLTDLRPSSLPRVE